jgi:hypothetical protein
MRRVDFRRLAGLTEKIDEKLRVHPGMQQLVEELKKLRVTKIEVTVKVPMQVVIVPEWHDRWKAVASPPDLGPVKDHLMAEVKSVTAGVQQHLRALEQMANQLAAALGKPLDEVINTASDLADL